jgi:tetratricopeptide (TPR) repeat protein
MEYFTNLNIALLFSGISLILSLLAYKKSNRNESENKLIKSNQLALEAWDILGGEPGAFRIKEAPDKANMVLAKRKIDEALIIDPNSSKANSVLGTYYALSNNHEAAAEVHEKLLRTDPLSAITFYNLAAAYVQLNMYDKAAGAYRNSINCEPARSACHHNFAHLLIRMEQYDEAIQEFETSITLKPEFVDSHYDLAYLYNKIGNQSKAIDVLLNSLNKMSNNTDKSLIYEKLGATYLEIGDQKKAIEALETAVELDANSAPAHEYLARAYESEGRYSDSKNEFILAKKIEPENLHHYFNLGQVYLRLGMKNESMKEFETVYKRDPFFPEIKTKIESLKKHT